MPLILTGERGFVGANATAKYLDWKAKEATKEAARVQQRRASQVTESAQPVEIMPTLDIK